MQEQKSFNVYGCQNNTEIDCSNAQSRPVAENKIQQYNNGFLPKPNLLTYQNSLTPISTSVKHLNGPEQRKPLQYLIDTLNVTNTISGSNPSHVSLPHSNTSTLNDLKLKFESAQSNTNRLSNNESYKHKPHVFLKTSEQFRQSIQSFSSSSSPQKTLSSLNITSLNQTNSPTIKCSGGAINQRISALKSLASRQYSSLPKSSYNSDTSSDQNNSTTNQSVQFLSKSNQIESKSNFLENEAQQNKKDECENINNFQVNQTKLLKPTVEDNESSIILPSKFSQSHTKTVINPDKKANDCFLEHSKDCKVILQKSHRRSKSLPAKFNIDSLLDYLNYSLILNKYGLKKLNQQLNLQINSPNYNFSLGHNHHAITNYYNHSSGYNSENQSNSSNSNLLNSYQKNDDSLIISQRNFYKLSLSHLPVHFLHLHCTCGANKVNSNSLNNYPSFAEESHKNILPSSLQSSSTNQLNFDDEEDDEDEDFSDEDIEEEVDEHFEKSLSEAAISESSKKKIENEADLSSVNFYPQWPHIKKDTEYFTRFKSSDMRYHLMTCAFTTDNQHTTRSDLRRIRSFHDLTQNQLVYSPSDFIIKEKLGEGFFANVSKIILKKTNQEMVLKELKFDWPEKNTEDNPIFSVSNECPDALISRQSDFQISYSELNAAHKSFLKEAQVLRNLNHPNVIKFIGIMFKKEKHLNLILEFISGGTLKDIIHNINKQLPWKIRVGYAKDISAAMQYLHSLNIIHRDLKSDNCLVKNNGRTVVVADFGLSRIIKYNNHNFKKICNENLAKTRDNSKFINYREIMVQNDSPSQIYSKKILPNLQTTCSTNSYIVAAKSKLKKRIFPQRKQRYAVVGNSFSMAPEMLKHQIYDERVDIFSFGIICCEIIGRVQADPDYLPRTSDFGLNVELFRMKYCEPACPKQFIKIAIACCELEPEKRPPFSKTSIWLETILSHINANTPIPKNLLKHMG